jgi:superfamily II DNA/RNA helicase
MLDMGFQDDIEDIINACPNITQMMSFSATITPELNQIITRYVGKEYDFIKTTAEVVVDKVDHSFIHVANIDKISLLDKFLNDFKDQKVLIFTQTKRSADDVAQQVHEM